MCSDWCGVTAAFAHITATQAMVAFVAVTLNAAQPVAGQTCLVESILSRHFIMLYNWLQAQPDRVRQQLIAEGLELEEVGGSIQVVETAAPKGKGLLDLEEALMLQVLLASLPFTQSRITSLPAIACSISSDFIC